MMSPSVAAILRPLSRAGTTTRLLHAMRRDGLTRGVVTLCIGGGQGIALAMERLV
jgi:acetyl-CoA acetyltransferase